MDTKKIATLAVHAGEDPDAQHGATVSAIHMATSYRSDPDTGFSVSDQSDDNAEVSYAYTRWANPTIDVLCQKLAMLENGEDAMAFGSGMAAITALFFDTLEAGDHVVMSDVCYAGASELANTILSKKGVEISRVNASRPELVEAAIRPRTALIYVESPCNPICRLTDLAAIAEIGRRKGIKTAVDSTFATPLATRPLDMGIDIVVHSLTKYMGGHGDAIGGALIGSRAAMSSMRQGTAARLGGIISPFNAWLINRGLATYPLRFRAHAAGGMHVAQFLEQHPRVTKVFYPGLSSHPQHQLASRQMDMYSGMLTFQVEDAAKAVKLMASELSIIHYAVSLGHHKSLIFYLSTSDMLHSSFHLTAEQEADYRQYAGDGIFRLSVGIEDPNDLCQDLKHVLDKL